MVKICQFARLISKIFLVSDFAAGASGCIKDIFLFLILQREQVVVSSIHVDGSLAQGLKDFFTSLKLLKVNINYQAKFRRT